MYSIKDKSRSVLLQALTLSRDYNLGIVNFSIDVLAEIALEQTWKAEQAAEIVRTNEWVLFSLFLQNPRLLNNPRAGVLLLRDGPLLALSPFATVLNSFCHQW